MNDASTRFRLLEPRYIAALDEAERLMFRSDFRKYFDLKSLLAEHSPEARYKFRSLFRHYYGLNAGGLTEEFMDKYFEILHSGNVLLNETPDYRRILNQLYTIKRRKGDYALQFSFVSKLVAIHHEENPIYDKYVVAFFGARPPTSSAEKELRIQWFVDFLSRVRSSYESSAVDPRVTAILDRFKSRDPRLAGCHVVRQLDFLVWMVGNQRLLEK